MTKDKSPERVIDVAAIRDTYQAQLPLIAAILAIGVDDFDPKGLAQDAIDLVIAIEEELG